MRAEEARKLTDVNWEVKLEDALKNIKESAIKGYSCLEILGVNKIMVKKLEDLGYVVYKTDEKMWISW